MKRLLSIVTCLLLAVVAAHAKYVPNTKWPYVYEDFTKGTVYSADNQIVARSADRCYIYEPKTNRSFCYDVKADGSMKESKDSKKFEPLRQYVFSMIQTAQYMLKKE